MQLSNDRCLISGKNFWLISVPRLTQDEELYLLIQNLCLEHSKKYFGLIPSIFHMNAIANIIYCKINPFLSIVSIGDNRNKPFGWAAYDSERVRHIHQVQNNINSTIERKLLS